MLGFLEPAEEGFYVRNDLETNIMSTGVNVVFSCTVIKASGWCDVHHMKINSLNEGTCCSGVTDVFSNRQQFLFQHLHPLV